ncbi:hypothetical protein [Microseira wollei]|uniref:Uncharacterized protein n=1 Tax=Microseira wollei NIES-4236 TaxID=2530354 RepID=A0AAV3XJI0_9CYAN|nr:hypothetical protein [Microseira wollei]GET40679.1 hypothetical protein MiSe_54900 [Microseira wollei NIES-4236]
MLSFLEQQFFTETKVMACLQVINPVSELNSRCQTHDFSQKPG